jgi:archaemetzincin
MEKVFIASLASRTSKSMRLIMQPIILNGKEILDDISFAITAVLPLFGFEEQKTRINQPVVQVPKYLFDSARHQYRSDRLLSWLEQTLRPSNDIKLVALCNFDAYFGNYNFCFGHAVIGGSIAAVYLQRLLPHSYTDSDDRLRALFQNRLIKEVAHELGHTFGLRHCSSNSCVMYKSKSINDTDNKNEKFCKICSNTFGLHMKSLDLFTEAKRRILQK